MSFRLHFDLGGTSLRLGLSKGGVFSQKSKMPSPDNPRRLREYIDSFIDKVTDGQKVSSIRGGITGRTNPETQVTEFCPRKPAFTGTYWKDFFKHVGTKDVIVVNDSLLVGLGEVFNEPLLLQKSCINMADLYLLLGLSQEKCCLIQQDWRVLRT